MRIVIIGGGKVGYYLCKALLENHHEIHLIEKDKERCNYLADELDITVICGDGTSIETLEAAKSFNADAVIAVTGKDEDNIIACQLAKVPFNAAKTICRSNNPENVDIMKVLGIDIPMSSTTLISDLIENEINAASLHLLRNIRGKGVISQIEIPTNAVINGLALSQINLPKETLIISILRNSELIIPRGDIRVYSGDELIVVSSNNNHKTLIKALTKQY